MAFESSQKLSMGHYYYYYFDGSLFACGKYLSHPVFMVVFIKTIFFLFSSEGRFSSCFYDNQLCKGKCD